MKRSSSPEGMSLPNRTAEAKQSLTTPPTVADLAEDSTLKPHTFPEGDVAGPKRFPDRLYELLNADSAPGSLYWLPGGKAFAIDQDNFATEVLDRYFQATKFASFIRRLHKWGFRRETRGFRKEIGPELSRSVIAFCHDLFQKDLPDLVKQMEEVAKKPQAGNIKEESLESSTKPKRKRHSSAESQHSSKSVEQQKEGSSPPKSQKKRPSVSVPTREVPVPEQKEDGMQQAVPLVASLPAAPLIEHRALALPVPTDRSVVPSREQSAHQLLQRVGQQLLLQNFRNNTLQGTRDVDNSLHLLLRHQQNSDSHLQRSIITASLAQQQQQLQEQELQRRLALVTATSNQAILDATATERMLQFRRSLAGPSTLSQAQMSLPSSLFAQADANRLIQERAHRDSNSHLRETLLLLELQRQQQQSQQGDPANQSPNPNRQFPPFG